MSRPTARRCVAPGISVPRGEVLVATEIGDPARGALPCPAAPLVGGALARRGIPVRYGPVPRCAEAAQGAGGAGVFATASLRQDGTATGIGAAADPADGLAMAAARGAVEEWSALVAPRRLLAAADPWCPGAAGALGRARAALAAGGPVYICEWLAAGAAERAELERAGAVFVASVADAPPGATVVLPAHGVPPAALAAAAERGLAVVDATCPLIAAVHGQVRRLADRGDHVVIVGARGHAAAAAIAAQAPGRAVFVESPAGAAGVRPADPRRVSYVLAPGAPVEDAAATSAALSSRFPSLRGPDPDGFCYAATDRAETIRTVAAGSDLVLVLGVDGDTDTKMAASLARASGGRAHALASASGVDAAWLAGTSAIGLVETFSAGPGLSAEVIGALSGLGPLSVTRRRVTTEVARRPAPGGVAAGGDGSAASAQQIPITSVAIE